MKPAFIVFDAREVVFLHIFFILLRGALERRVRAGWRHAEMLDLIGLTG